MLGKTSKLSLSKLTPLQDNDVRHKSNFMSTCGFQLPVSVLTPVCFHNQFCPTKKKYIFSNHYYLLPVQCSCQLYTKRVWYDIKIFLFHSMNYSDCSLVITRTLGINRMNLLEI